MIPDGTSLIFSVQPLNHRYTSVVVAVVVGDGGGGVVAGGDVRTSSSPKLSLGHKSAEP